MPAGGRSSRAANTAQTRRALIDAALQLFATRGYDNTTTDEIAEYAGVSPRTFFRYFRTKESVLLHGEADFVQSFAGAYRAQPDTTSDMVAMRQAFVALAPGISRLRDRIRLYQRAVASSPTLRGRERSGHEANVAVIARAIADRRGLPDPDGDCHLSAAVGLVVLERALITWVNGPARDGLADSIQAEFARLDKLLR